LITIVGKNEHTVASSEYGNVSAVSVLKPPSSEYGEAPAPSSFQTYGAAPSMSEYASARDLPNVASGTHYKELINAQQLEAMNQEVNEARLSSQTLPVPRPQLPQ
jgi:hypothetical protein